MTLAPVDKTDNPILPSPKFCCARCSKFQPQAGSSWIRRKGLPGLHFCADCRPGQGAKGPKHG